MCQVTHNRVFVHENYQYSCTQDAGCLPSHIGPNRTSGVSVPKVRSSHTSRFQSFSKLSHGIGVPPPQLSHISKGPDFEGQVDSTHPTRSVSGGSPFACRLASTARRLPPSPNLEPWRGLHRGTFLLTLGPGRGLLPSPTPLILTSPRYAFFNSLNYRIRKLTRYTEDSESDSEIGPWGFLSKPHITH